MLYAVSAMFFCFAERLIGSFLKAFKDYSCFSGNELMPMLALIR